MGSLEVGTRHAHADAHRDHPCAAPWIPTRRATIATPVTTAIGAAFTSAAVAETSRHLAFSSLFSSHLLHCGESTSLAGRQPATITSFYDIVHHFPGRKPPPHCNGRLPISKHAPDAISE